MNKQLTVVQQATLALLKCGLGLADPDFDFSAISPQLWNGIFKECKAQTVQLICFDAAAEQGIELPEKVYEAWFSVSALTLSKVLKVADTQKKLVALLDENGIPYTILKGFASAHYYPDREKRCAGDIDFLVGSDNMEKTVLLLKEHGYEEEDKPNENHLAFCKDGVWLELHHSIAGMPDGKAGEVLREEVGDIIARSVTDTDGGFKRPTDLHHGIVILLHTLHHLLSSGLGLRHLCDWACFVNTTKDEPFWQELLALLRRAGLEKMAYIVTEACVRYLDCPCPSWLPLDNGQVADDFMDELLRSGNFGYKDLQLKGTQMMVIKNSEELNLGKKLKRMIKSLNDTNHQIYPVLDRLPWLYPFIMVWRVCRYLWLMLLGKRQSLIKASRYADERNKLFKKFELYKTDGE